MWRIRDDRYCLHLLSTDFRHEDKTSILSSVFLPWTYLKYAYLKPQQLSNVNNSYISPHQKTHIQWTERSICIIPNHSTRNHYQY